MCLWLGANIMVEYTFEEARKLLGKNLENAKANLTRFVISTYSHFSFSKDTDISFLKD